MTSVCCGKSHVKHHIQNGMEFNQALDGSYVIDGVLYPRYEREIDRDGFECSHHSLKFHGDDWDIPLTQRRGELTKGFIEDASAATKEPEGNIRDLRFFLADNYLLVKFTVRHQTNISAKGIQSDLLRYSWEKTKSFYRAREKRVHPTSLQNTEEKYAAKSLKLQLSCDLNKFGRPNAGDEGPKFRDGKDTDEEPYPYEVQRSASEKFNKLYASFRIT